MGHGGRSLEQQQQQGREVARAHELGVPIAIFASMRDSASTWQLCFPYYQAMADGGAPSLEIATVSRCDDVGEYEVDEDGPTIR